MYRTLLEGVWLSENVFLFYIWNAQKSWSHTPLSNVRYVIVRSEELGVRS